jgi:hypothetical protein
MYMVVRGNHKTGGVDLRALLSLNPAEPEQVSSLAQGLEDGLSIRDRGITYDRPIKALTHV